MLTKKILTATKHYLSKTPEENRAYGLVTDGKINPGTFRFMPVLAWLRKKPERSRIVLSGFLLRMTEGAFVGGLDWSIPLNPETENDAANLLSSFGWDNRVWPSDPGWPDDLPDEEHTLHGMLKKKGILETLTFPPKESGNRVMTLHVLKVSNPFPLPILVADEDRQEVAPEMLSKLRELVADPSCFSLSS